VTAESVGQPAPAPRRRSRRAPSRANLPTSGLSVVSRLRITSRLTLASGCFKQRLQVIRQGGSPDRVARPTALRTTYQRESSISGHRWTRGTPPRCRAERAPSSAPTCPLLSASISRRVGRIQSRILPSQRLRTVALPQRALTDQGDQAEPACRWWQRSRTPAPQIQAGGDRPASKAATRSTTSSKPSDVQFVEIPFNDQGK